MPARVVHRTTSMRSQPARSRTPSYEPMKLASRDVGARVSTADASSNGLPLRASSFAVRTRHSFAQQAPGGSAAPPLMPRPAFGGVAAGSFGGSFSRGSTAGSTTRRIVRRVSTTKRSTDTFIAAGAAQSGAPRPPSASSVKSAGSAGSVSSTSDTSDSEGVLALPPVSAGRGDDNAENALPGDAVDQLAAGKSGVKGTKKASFAPVEAGSHPASTASSGNKSTSAAPAVPTTLSAKLRTASNKLVSMEYQLKQARQRLAVQAVEMVMLEKQRNKLEAAADTKKTAERIAAAERATADAEKQVAALQRSVSEKETALAARKAEIDELKQDLARATQTASADLEYARNEAERLRNAMVEAQSRCAELEGQVGQLQGELDAAAERLAAAQRAPASVVPPPAAEQPPAVISDPAMASELRDALSQLVATRDEVTRLEKAVAAAEEQRVAAETAAEEARQEATAAKEEQKSSAAASAPASPVKVNHDACRAVVEHRDRVIVGLKEDAAAAQAKAAAAAADAKKSAAALKTAKASATAELAAARAEAEKEAKQLRQRIATLEAHIKASEGAATAQEGKLTRALQKISEQGQELVDLRASAGESTKHLVGLRAAEARVAELEAALSKARSDGEDAQRAAQDAKRAAEAAAKQGAEASASAEAKAQSALDSLHAEVAELKQHIEAKDGKIAQGDATIGDLRLQLAAFETTKAKLADSEAAYKSARGDIGRMSMEAKQLEGKLSRTEAELAKAKEAAAEAAKMQSELGIKTSQVKQLEGDVNRLVKQSMYANKASQQLRAEKEAVEEQLRRARKLYSAASLKAGVRETSEKTATQAAVAEAEATRVELENANKIIVELRARILKLQGERDSAKESAGATKDAAGKKEGEMAELRLQVLKLSRKAKAKDKADAKAAEAEAARKALEGELAELRLKLEKAQATASTSSRGDKTARREAGKLREELAAEHKRAEAALLKVAQLEASGREERKRTAEAKNLAKLHEAKARKLQCAVDEAGAASSSADDAKAAAHALGAATKDLLEKLRTAINGEMKARDGLANLKVLFKAAEISEMKKVVESLRQEVKASKDTVSILVYNVMAAEKKIGHYDAEAAEKQRLAREEQLEKLQVKLEKERKSASSFQSTSDINVERLTEIKPRTEQKKEEAVSRRVEIVRQLLSKAEEATSF